MISGTTISITGTAALMICTSTPVNAQSYGHELQSYCERFLNEYKPVPNSIFETIPDDRVAQQCYGFLTVVRVAYERTRMLPKQCVPRGTSTVQLIRVIVDYGRQQPEELRLPSMSFVLNALLKGFDCTK
jgi:Rap1a immunity proteins